MTTCLTLITDAMREINLIPVGATPTANEQVEGLRRLNTLVASVFGEELGEFLADWPVPLPQRTAPIAANYPQLPYPMGLDGNPLGVPFATSLSTQFAFYPPCNSRLIYGGVTGTVYFPEAPNDGARMSVVQGSGAGDSGVDGAVLTLNGNGRTIGGSATTTFTWHTVPTAPIHWFYRADKGDWVVVNFNLAISDTFPFPTELDDPWALGLALRLAPRYGKTISPETANAAKRGLMNLKARYRQTAPTVYKSADIPNSAQSFYGGQWGWQ